MVGTHEGTHARVLSYSTHAPRYGTGHTVPEAEGGRRYILHPERTFRKCWDALQVMFRATSTCPSPAASTWHSLLPPRGTHAPSSSLLSPLLWLTSLGRQRTDLDLVPQASTFKVKNPPDNCTENVDFESLLISSLASRGSTAACSCAFAMGVLRMPWVHTDGTQACITQFLL